MTPIQKPQALHVLEIVHSTHQVRSYLEGLDKYVSWLEWRLKEKDGVIEELRADLSKEAEIQADELLSECSDTASYGSLIDREDMTPVPFAAGVVIYDGAQGIRDGSCPYPESLNGPVPVSDFQKMTETEQEQLTVVEVPEAKEIELVKRRGCPPGGWPKKDQSEVKEKKEANPKKIKSNLRPYELLGSNDLLELIGHIERLGRRALALNEIQDSARSLRIDKDLMTLLVKKYGRIHRAGKAIPMILSMKAKNKGKPYPLDKLGKLAKTFPSIHFPTIQKPN